MLETLSSAIGIVAILASGVWVLINKWLTASKMLEDERRKNIVEEIKESKKASSELASVMAKINETLSARIRDVELEVQRLREANREHTASVVELSRSIDRTMAFLFEKEKYSQTDKIRLGKDTILVRDKKKPEGE